MNQPEGFDMTGGQPTNVEPLTAMFAPNAFPYEFTHGALAAYVAMGLAVAGVYAFAMLAGDRSDYNKKALMLGIGLAAVFAPLQVFTGHLSVRHVAHDQPEDSPPRGGSRPWTRALHIGGILPEDGETRFAVKYLNRDLPRGRTPARRPRRHSGGRAPARLACRQLPDNGRPRLPVRLRRARLQHAWKRRIDPPWRCLA
jgi:hypothetical protein